MVVPAVPVAAVVLAVSGEVTGGGGPPGGGGGGGGGRGGNCAPLSGP